MKSINSLVATAFLGAANDNFFKNALVMLIAFKGMQVWGLDHKSVIALAGGIFILPYFLFSGIAGEVSDRLERSKVIRATKYWELLIMLGASLCFFLEAYDWLLLVLFCMGAQSTFFSPAKYSAILDLSDEKTFMKSNAHMETATFLAILLGTIGGGVAAAHKTAPYEIISAGILGMAIIGIIISLKVPKLKALSPKLPRRLNPVPPTIRIVKDSFASKDIFWTIMATSWFWFLGASLLALIPVLAKDILLTDESVATAFLACFTVGIGLGSLLCEKLSYGRVELALSPIGALVASIFLVDLSLASGNFSTVTTGLGNLKSFLSQPGSIRVIIDMIMISLACGVFIVPLNAWLQVASKPELRSRVIACNNIINALAMVLSAGFIMGMHAFNIPSLQIFSILGILTLVIMLLLAWAYPKLSLRLWVWTQARCLRKSNILGQQPSQGEKHVFLCETQQVQEIASVLAHTIYPSLIIYDRSLVRTKPLRLLLSKNESQGIEDWNQVDEMRHLIQNAINQNQQILCFFSTNETADLLKNQFLENQFQVYHLKLDHGEPVRLSKFVPVLKVKNMGLNFEAL